MSEFEAYRSLFVAESRENHERMVNYLLALEKGSDPEAIGEIFRAIHTLKGASASMGFGPLEHLCHTMEDVFQLIRNGTAPMTSDLGNLLLSCSDMIEQMIDDVEEGGDSSSQNPDENVGALKAWLAGNTPPAGGTQEPAAPPPARPAAKKPGKRTAKATPATAPAPAVPAADGLPVYDIRITVAGECMMKDVRALLAVSNLEALGKIVSSSPTKDQLDEGTCEGTVTVRIASDAGEEALRTAAFGSEISEVAIVPAGTPFPGHLPGSESQAAGEQAVPATSPEVPAKGAAAQEKTREIKHLRVDIHQLDHIMTLVEDLVINRGRLKQISDEHRIKEMDEAIGMVERSVADLQNLMMNIRMIPLSHIFNRLPRVVRDVAQYDGKEVEFIIEGGETELDRSVMDGLNDPLLHLIRNAVNHGIEPPGVREKAGKARKGLVRLSARRDRDNVIIELTDDGGGINIGKVKEKAVARGLLTGEEASALSTEGAIDLLFQPGFSTAETITDISGRGVGLDVVKRAIEALKGTIRVETAPGKGSRFELLLPPTMAIVDVMIVRIGERRIAIPVSTIMEVANFEKGATHQIGTNETILLRDEVIQVTRLDDMFGSNPDCPMLVVVQYQKRKCSVPVSSVEGKQEVVVKPLSGFIGNIRGISGLTILGDGNVVPVLDINTMI